MNGWIALRVSSLIGTFALAQIIPAQWGNVERVALPMEMAPAVSQSLAVGLMDGQQVLHVAISLEPTDRQGLERTVDRVSNPRGNQYRQFLTPAQIGERFGMSREHVQEVVDYLRGEQVEIELVSQNRMAILARGSVRQWERVFGTQILRYQALQPVDGITTFYANGSALTFPRHLAGRVVNVEGLENVSRPRARALTCTQARTLYRVSPLFGEFRGEGRTIGISNWDGFRLANVPLYTAAFALPTPEAGTNIQVVPIGGGSGAGTASGEGDLDIQMVVGMAPLSRVIIYDGGGGLTAVLAKAADDNAADIISDSWGWNLTVSAAIAAHDQHLAMSAQGITYLAASGDDGTTLEPYSYPSYDPEVLLVGGTTATVNAASQRVSEVGWSGSGGGYTTKAVAFNRLPAWQSGNGVPDNLNYRLSPDVSMHAGGSGTGAYTFFWNGALTTNMVGTSFVSPLLAGGLGVASQKLIALGRLSPDASGNRRLGRIQDLLYEQNGRSDAWFDVTTGTNGNLPNGTPSVAHAGWDMVTGWGAIDVDGFVNVLAPAGAIQNPGFEQGDVAWTNPSQVIVHAGAVPPRTGIWNAILGGKGKKNTTVLAQPFSVPATGTPKLSLWTRIQTNETGGTVKDRLKIVLVDASGNLLKSLGSFSNVAAGSAYTKRTFGLKAFRGRVVTVVFECTESGPNATWFAVDDLAIE